MNSVKPVNRGTPSLLLQPASQRLMSGTKSTNAKIPLLQPETEERSGSRKIEMLLLRQEPAREACKTSKGRDSIMSGCASGGVSKRSPNGIWHRFEPETKQSKPFSNRELLTVSRNLPLLPSYQLIGDSRYTNRSHVYRLSTLQRDKMTCGGSKTVLLKG